MWSGMLVGEQQIILKTKYIENKQTKVDVTIFSFHIFPGGTLLLSAVLGNLEQLMSCRHRGPTRCVYRPTGGAEE